MNKKSLSRVGGIMLALFLSLFGSQNAAAAVSVKDYGATGDGTTNDAPAINAAISAVPPGTDLYFPQGNYRISSTVTITKPLSILGAGVAGSEIDADAGVTALVVGYPLNQVRIQDIAIRSIGLTKTAGSAGIRAAPPTISPGIGYLVIQNVNVTGFAIGIDERNVQIGSLKEVFLDHNGTGLYQWGCRNMAISGGAFEYNDYWGIDLDGDAAHPENNCGTRITAPLIANNGASNGGNLQIRHQEHFTLLGAVVDVPSAGSVYNVNVDHCFRANIGGGTWIGGSKVTGIAMTNCHSVTVNGGTKINSSAGFGISLDNCHYCIVADNVMIDNGNADLVLLNTSGTGNSNAVNGNTLLSTAAAYSVVEVGANKSIVTENRVKGSIILDGGSTASDNHTIP